MKKLGEDLKRMLTALAHQNDGEFLSMHEKMKKLGLGTENRAAPSPAAPSRRHTTARRRIAFISDGRGQGAPLDYAIDACSKQGATLDLLLHDGVEAAKTQSLENRIQATGIDCRRIPLGDTPVNQIIDYIFDHPSVVFIVSLPEDRVAKALIEETASRRAGRIPIPLVLMEDHPSVCHSTQSAA